MYITSMYCNTLLNPHQRIILTGNLRKVIQHSLTSVLCLSILLFASGCKNTTAIPIAHQIITTGTGTDHAIIYLHGRGDHPQAFSKNGLNRILENDSINATIYEVNAHFGYYMNRTLHERLEEDIFPLLEKTAFKKVWFVGNSMGGLGALLHAQKFPTKVDAIVLMGPYLGGKKFIRRFSREINSVQFESDSVHKDNWQKQLWAWIKNISSKPDSRPTIYLTYGTNDRLGQGQKLLHTLLPSDRVVTIAGAHDWPEWKEGFTLLVRKGIFAIP